MGYDFCWTVLDTKNYCLPQRRNRVWGIATVTQGSGGSTSAEVCEKYKECLLAMQTNFQFDLDMIFTPRPTQKPKPGRHTFLVEKAKAEGFQFTDLFIDCQGSRTRNVYCQGAVPCITRNHPVYFLLQERYLSGVDFLRCQGLWESVWKSRVFSQLKKDDKFCQDLAGNSFSATVVQCVFLSLFASTSRIWGSDGSAGHGDSNNGTTSSSGSLPAPTALLRRVSSKRKAPEYNKTAVVVQGDQPKHPTQQQRPKRKRRGLTYKRKAPGVDSRKTNKGKSTGLSIWDKEMMILSCSCMYIFIYEYLLYTCKCMVYFVGIVALVFSRKPIMASFHRTYPYIYIHIFCTYIYIYFNK